MLASLPFIILNALVIFSNLGWPRSKGMPHTTQGGGWPRSGALPTLARGGSDRPPPGQGDYLNSMILIFLFLFFLKQSGALPIVCF